MNEKKRGTGKGFSRREGLEPRSRWIGKNGRHGEPKARSGGCPERVS